MSLSNTIKSHNYSIITAIIIGILTAVYLFIIVPNNEAKEDTNNLAIFKGIEGQLQGYIDDKLQGISPEQMDSIKFKNQKYSSQLDLNSKYYINKIEIVKLESSDLQKRKLKLTRNIFFKKDDGSKNGLRFQISDTVEFDLKKFIKRINSSSNFKSFFICPITISDIKSNEENALNPNTSKDKGISSDKNKQESSNIGKCLVNEVLISKNINLKDEDSLCFHNRNDGPITFKNSATRFYTSQLRIPDVDYTLFLAAGIRSSYFKSNVHYIKPNHLIFGLLLITILFLSLFFIKPIVLGYKELLSQMDLIRVVFSIGALIAIFVIFGMVGFWKITISNRNKSDLKQLTEYIDRSFNNQIDTLKNWRKYPIISDSLNGSKYPLKKLYVASDTIISLIDKDSIYSRDFFNAKININKAKDRIQVLDATKFDKNDSLKHLKCLDVYFWMNQEGLLTASLDKQNISFPRKYNDREYFKLLQNKKIDAVLTGVFLRESDNYALIYAEKDSILNPEYAEKFAIKGIAFREHFSKEIKLPPDTDFMLVDRRGSVLAQQNPSKKLYQNVLVGSNNNLILASVLAGCDIPNFQMDYQGYTYQVYAKKLTVPTDYPVYILGIRNLNYLDYLSQFTFINSVLMVYAYGIIIVFLILIYSSLFFNGRKAFFAREHFFHLFHDYSKKVEYNTLKKINIICFIAALIFFLFSSPITALYFTLLLSFNITFINVIVLNIRHEIFENHQVKFYMSVLLFGFAIPFLFLYLDQLYFSIIFIVASHLVIISIYKRFNNTDTNSAEIADSLPKPLVVQRSAYLHFLTSALMNHFVMFPFIMVCVFYSNEINDYARYYCSKSQPKTENNIHKRIDAYGCKCISQEPVLNVGSNNEGFIRKLNFGFKEPTRDVVNNYTINGFSKSFYFKTLFIISEARWNIVFILLAFIFLVVMAFALLNYYSNRFFFFELMQVSYANYYPTNKTELTEKQKFINSIFDIEIGISNNHEGNNINSLTKNREIAINNAFSNDINHEISLIYKNEFKLNSNQLWFEKAYESIWKEISSESQENEENNNKLVLNVLYDFAQDSFSNYKNKDIIMKLMDLGIIDHNKSNGRLQIRSESFRKFILLKSKLDVQFVDHFKKESSNGTFDKLRLPIVIVATSLLLLLMYLNKDRYNQLEIMGTTIGSVIILVNKFLSMGKS
jgi:hypothetical protein